MVMVSSRVREVTVRNAEMASDANCELLSNTAAFIFSNFTSYLTRINIARIISGKAENIATNVNFQPKAKATETHPMILNTEIRGNAIW